ncbi:hypothetical protein JCM6882_006562 [Rhodosporidiobolus microsporus]
MAPPPHPSSSGSRPSTATSSSSTVNVLPASLKGVATLSFHPDDDSVSSSASSVFSTEKKAYNEDSSPTPSEKTFSSIPAVSVVDGYPPAPPHTALDFTLNFNPVKGGFQKEEERGEEGGGMNEGVPDGGLRAWMNVAGGWLILFSTFGNVNAWGVYQAYYQLYRYPRETASAISWIGSVQLCLFFLMALVAGPLFDKGHFRLLIAAGSALWIASVFLIPQATTYSQTMGVQGILGGMGVGLLFLPALSIQSHWFSKRRNLAIGIVASASSLGGIAFPIMLNKLFSNPSVGFATGVRASGAVIASCLVLANLLVSPNPAMKGIQKPPFPPLKQIFTGPYTLLVLGAMILNFGLWFPNFYIELYGKFQGLPDDLTPYLLAIFNAGSFFGRTIPNLLADRTGPFVVQTVCCLSAGIVLFFMHLATSSVGVVVFAALYGFLSGGFISLVSPVCVTLSRDLSEIGLRQGIAFLIVAGAAVGGNPIAGRLFAQAGNDFLAPIVFAGTMTTAGALLIAAGCFLLMKQRGTWKV